MFFGHSNRLCKHAYNRYPELRRAFQQSPLKQQIDRFEKGEDTTGMPDGYGLYMPVSPNKPLFTTFIEKAVIPNEQIELINAKGTIKIPFDPKTDVLFDGGDYIFILNSQAPYTDAYTGDNKLLAGMALTHLLGIPKKRIFNSVSLTPDHIGLLERMKESAFEYLSNQQNRIKLVNKVRVILENKLTANKIPDELRAHLINTFENDSKSFIKFPMIKSNVEFYFHPSPCHSVGHLHMHILPKLFRTSRLHDDVSVPVDTIIKYLKTLANANNFGRKRQNSLKRLKSDLQKLNKI